MTHKCETAPRLYPSRYGNEGDGSRQRDVLCSPKDVDPDTCPYQPYNECG